VALVTIKFFAEVFTPSVIVVLKAQNISKEGAHFTGSKD
jgi:hypothetical protein